jgi:hypothetical protein
LPVINNRSPDPAPDPIIYLRGRSAGPLSRWSFIADESKTVNFFFGALLGALIDNACGAFVGYSREKLFEPARQLAD